MQTRRGFMKSVAAISGVICATCHGWEQTRVAVVSRLRQRRGPIIITGDIPPEFIKGTPGETYLVAGVHVRSAKAFLDGRDITNLCGAVDLVAGWALLFDGDERGNIKFYNEGKNGGWAQYRRDFVTGKMVRDTSKDTYTISRLHFGDVRIVGGSIERA